MSLEIQHAALVGFVVEPDVDLPGMWAWKRYPAANARDFDDACDISYESEALALRDVLEVLASSVRDDNGLSPAQWNAMSTDQQFDLAKIFYQYGNAAA